MILSVALILPIVFIILKNKKNKRINLVFCLYILILTFLVIIFYNYKYQFQYVYLLNKENYTLYLVNFLSLYFMIDGISIWFISLTSVLICVCTLSNWNVKMNFRKELIILMFILFYILLLLFTVMDLLLFYILFEATLIPMFIIIGIWGTRNEKIRATWYFFFYTLIGSFFMLLSIFKIYSLIGTTSYLSLLSLEIPSNAQFWLFIGFFLGLSVKIPMIPFHIWLPQAHVEAPTNGSILLAGILLKLGGYGMIRFLFPLFPVASQYFSPFCITLSIIAILYGGLSTFRQNDMKRLIAYSSVSHMGLVTLSIFTHSIEGLIASYAMMLAHGLISSGLFLSVGILYSRHHSRIIKYYKGITKVMPLFSLVSFILIIGNISFPLTFNFIAEFYTLITAFQYSWITGLSVTSGIFIGAAYSFYLYNRVFFGKINYNLVKTREVSKSEFNSYIPLIAPTIYFGITPSLLVQPFILSAYLNITN